VIRINHDAREKTVVAEPVREERQILNVKFAMDGQDALVARCIFRENHQRSLGNRVGGRERIGQTQEEIRVLRKSAEFRAVFEDALIVHGVIVLLVRISSIRVIHMGIQEGLKIVNGIHVRGTDMVGSAAGSDGEMDLVGRSEVVIVNEMHGWRAWRGICCVGAVVFQFYGDASACFTNIPLSLCICNKKRVAPFSFIFV
jgi:hypothetical protein